MTTPDAYLAIDKAADDAANKYMKELAEVGTTERIDRLEVAVPGIRAVFLDIARIAFKAGHQSGMVYAATEVVLAMNKPTDPG